MIKKIAKTFIKLLLAIIVFIGLYILTAFVFSIIPSNKEPIKGNDVSVFILTNGVHTDLVLPIKTDQIDWSKYVKFENTINKDSSMQYLAFGWGDKGFYLETPTWNDLKFKTAFKAAFGLSSSAIHATFYKQLKKSEKCVEIKLSKEQYQRLVSYVKDSFLKNDKGDFLCIRTNANYGNNDAFYEATGSYSLFQTCNTWANNGLKCCGQKACLWTPFDKGIFYHYQNE